VVTIPTWKQDLNAVITGDVGPGDTVVVCVRPEKIQIAEQPASNDNCLEGVVVNSTYIGSDTHVFLDVGGVPMKSWEQNRISTLDPRAFYRKGQKLWLTLHADNVLVLPKE
jgi:ABC-type Fe3+/spermidine/putrescine transport system ATPase subunit